MTLRSSQVSIEALPGLNIHTVQIERPTQLASVQLILAGGELTRVIIGNTVCYGPAVWSGDRLVSLPGSTVQIEYVGGGEPGYLLTEWRDL